MKIGDTVYKKVLFNGVLSYKVFEIREQEEIVFYAIRCENCKHYPHCELLITVSDNTKNKPDNEKVYWEEKDASFVVGDWFESLGHLVDEDKVEVVANIHENPELLEK